MPQTGTTICGAALAETEERTVEAWQAIVDRLNA
jgi:hypothetical protein